METENLITTSQSTIRERMLASAGPLLWIAISYVDPGKWAAAIEGGSRFGLDLSLLLLVINFAAILYQYLSACIAIATGKDLAQVCIEEYDNMTCILLGVLVEISMIALDLTMVLSTAYGLNAVFGIDIFNCVFLTGFDAIFFPLLSSLFENPKAKYLSTCLASFILVSCIFGLCISQSESSFPVGGMLTKLNGESAYALMSFLGANIMPYNFFLHSSAVKLTQRKLNLSKGTLCQDHFFAIICIFSVIFLLNYMLMNLAANVLYGTGLVLLTLQDALSLLDQVFKNSVPSVGLIFIVFCSSQLIALRWYVGRQVIIQDLFKTDIPGWLHRATIRIIALIPALYCVWNTGAEGIFQLLIFTQVLVGLLLPSSAIPLFRIASSKSVMGAYKIPMLVEFFTLISFVGILGVKIVFVVEMIFGSSDWVSSLKWNIGNIVPFPYLILLVGAFSSFCLMLWLGTTPLKSASSAVDAQALIWGIRTFAPEPCADGDQTGSCASQHNLDSAREQQELELSFDKSIGDDPKTTGSIADLNFPETLMDTASDLKTVQEIKYEVPSPGSGSYEVSATTGEVAVPLSLHNELLECKPQVASSLSAEPDYLVEKTSPNEEHLPPEKGDEVDPWEPEESTKDVPDSSQSSLSDGPGSFRSISGKSDEIGSGAGSLSRLAGLGRAARRQLTTTLDEFWGQLFDFHGQTTQEAKSKKLDVLLGTDPKIDIKSSLVPVRSDSTCKDSTGYIPSVSGRGSDSVRSSSIYNSPKQQIAQGGVGSPLGVHKVSSMWSPNPQLLDAYVRNSSDNALNSGERRYHSVHVPAAPDGYNQQPATVHGYDLAWYLDRTSIDKGSDYQVDQLESLKKKSTPPVKSNSKELFARALVQKPQNGLRTLTPPGFHNVPVSRNSSLNIERPFHEHSTPEHVDFANNPVDLKKFYSLPDISGLYVPHRDSSLTGNHDGYGQSISRLAREQTYQSASSWASTSLGFSELSPSKVCRDAFSLQFSSGLGANSLWSKQPYERFGVADKPLSYTQETASNVEFEAKLLQSFRSCIMKLLKLEGFDWLFRQNDGTDEDLIDRVAARERVLCEVEARAIDRKLGSAMKNDDADHSKLMSVPNCGEGCVWRADIVVSFGVWCIHRILELSLMESRPELWGKYTYVLNRLQGIIDLAFTKPRSPPVPCFCLEIPPGYERKSSPPISNGSLPPTAKMARGKFTTAAMLLDMIKDVEIAISCRKGRTGTAAGDVAFPKGKENLASVLKRYRRRLSNKPVGPQETGHGSRKL